jgi:hypothetical protein
MECDIHAFIEEKHDGQWRYGPSVYEVDFRRTEWGRERFNEPDEVGANCPIDQRNYPLFGFMARVRSDDTPCMQLLDPQEVVCQRGAPPDMAPETLQGKTSEEWLSDTHSHSWLTLEEMAAGLMAATLAGEAEEFSDQLLFSLKQMKARAKEAGLPASDMRVVFWFDN